MIKKVFVTIILALLVGLIMAENVPTAGKNKSTLSTDELKEAAAGCLAGAFYTELNINNVRARINSGGDMWWDLNTSAGRGTAQYEIPKGSKKTSMFAGALWIGGIDVNGQLKLAAQRYRQVGVDFFPGPLSLDGTAYISSDECTRWDKIWTIYRKDVDNFLLWWAEDSSNILSYDIPQYFFNYPAHGDPTKGQSLYIAPFFDNNGDGFYNPADGDYPYYDIDNSLCKQNLPTLETERGYSYGGIMADQVLKGDQTLFWVFNDRGNIHTETQGQQIGLEIRAQAFAFTTNDEINNMTFYSFEIINRSTYTLYETYMSLWTDPDLGFARDDYLGCDVERGLGYCYNGLAVDGQGQIEAYGDQPPAVGIDFFQGPYMDPDDLDNPKYYVYTDEHGNVIQEQICDESINGVNFGDGIIDNERFGMRRFVYHNNTTGVPEYMTDPEFAIEYYNFLKGIWKDNTKMLYGGNAHASSGAYGPECDFMFPGDTDPCDWGTGGVPPNGDRYWTEQTAGNLPNDRRFMQSAGPFTLRPGALNYVTVGLPWARATSGGPFASVELLRKVDDKCQRLFENCFKVLDGPDAPDLVIQELNRELILFITNKPTSNNANEDYAEIDPSIVSPVGTPPDQRYDSVYRFQGYQIYQVKDATVTANDIHDATKARLVAQCDIKDSVSRLINFYYNEDLDAMMPVEEVNGANEGIKHSFRILEDQFASGDKRLVNNKKYYYLAVAYAFNEFKKYSHIPGALGSIDGQPLPYLMGRKNIQVYTAIPHITEPENGGTVINANYGDGVEITRVEGQGNGANILDITSESENNILANNYVTELKYKAGRGPINVSVVDPLNVVNARYTLKFDNTVSQTELINGNIGWTLEVYNPSGNLISTHNSQKAINFNNEQLFLDLGISITIEQCLYPGNTDDATNGFIEATMTYKDSTHRWLSGVPDEEGSSPLNWIRSGTLDNVDNPEESDYYGSGKIWLDPQQYYEKILGGTWAPYRLVSTYADHPIGGGMGSFISFNDLSNLASVDLIITPDKSKWTRCVVIETCDDPTLAQGGASKMTPRKATSVDKNGNPDPSYDYPTGMGWFPGYAINIETGERLNIIFGEDSWLAGDNGNDMIFNPTSRIMTNLGQLLLGGKHFVYIVGHNGDKTTTTDNYPPAYDGGKWIYEKLNDPNAVRKNRVWQNVLWVGIPLSVENEPWLDNDVRIRFRVKRPYDKFYSTPASANNNPNPQNGNYPMYSFSTANMVTVKGDLQTAKDALDLINVVPNPYYAWNSYETNQVDNRVRITNLPSKCTISIYSTSGQLIRQYTKDDPEVTFLDWDLKNHAGIPISGGLYLIHVKAPGVGEKVIKWFGALRPIDLNAF